MELSAEQKESVAQWAAQGKSLAEIQKSLFDDWTLSLTYMEVRFLLDDLDLSLQDREETAKPSPKVEAEKMPGPDGVRVEVDKLVKPGTVVSGTVTFSDGVKAGWQVDQMGRLGLNPSQKGYKPDPEDFMEFQTQLQNALQKQGF